MKSVCFLIKPLYSWQALKKKKPHFSNLSFSSWRHNTQTRGKVSREDKINFFFYYFFFFRKTRSQVELSMNDLRELLLLICTNTSQHCRHTPPSLGSVELDGEREEKNQNRYCSLCLTTALKCKNSSGKVVRVHK